MTECGNISWQRPKKNPKISCHTQRNSLNPQEAHTHTHTLMEKNKNINKKRTPGVSYFGDSDLWMSKMLLHNVHVFPFNGCEPFLPVFFPWFCYTYIRVSLSVYMCVKESGRKTIVVVLIENTNGNEMKKSIEKGETTGETNERVQWRNMRKIKRQRATQYVCSIHMLMIQSPPKNSTSEHWFLSKSIYAMIICT